MEKQKPTDTDYEIYKPWWRWLIMVGVFIIIGSGILFHLWANNMWIWK